MKFSLNKRDTMDKQGESCIIRIKIPYPNEEQRVFTLGFFYLLNRVKKQTFPGFPLGTSNRDT